MSEFALDDVALGCDTAQLPLKGEDSRQHRTLTDIALRLTQHDIGSCAHGGN